MIIVTGGAGFIGSNLLSALELKTASPLYVCDYLGSGNKWKNILKRQIADIIRPSELFSFLDKAGHKVEGIFHLGAVSATTARDGDLTFQTNFRLSKELFTWCTEYQVPFIYASSAATYGEGECGFLDDNQPSSLARLRPLNLYGWTKHLFDRYVLNAVEQNQDLPPQWAGLKFFNVYGPNEYHKEGQRSVVSQLFESLQKDPVARLFKSYRTDYKDGGQKRDFVYVKDCVNVMLWLFENPKVTGLFNVGTGRARTFLDLANGVFSALERPPKIEFIPMPDGLIDKYQYYTEASVTRLREFGYDVPFTELESGIHDYVKNYLQAPDPYI